MSDAGGIVSQQLKPEVPTREVQREIENWLRDNPERIGQVFRLREEGHSYEDMWKVQEIPKYTLNCRLSYLDALLKANLPSTTTLAKGAARRFRKILKSQNISHQTRRILEANLEILNATIADPENKEKEAKQSHDSTIGAERIGRFGVYVYTLPHYWDCPYDQETGRTLMKVGYSDRDVIKRFRSQTRITALPEEPILLRVYPAKEGLARQIEQEFHQRLKASGHERDAAGTAGREWFLTDLDFLDDLAIELGLEVDRVFDGLQTEE